MKKQSKKRVPKPVSEDRILQLSNDESEGIESGSKREWKSAALYFRREHDRLWNDLGRLRCEVAVLVSSQEMHRLASAGLSTWLKSQTQTSTA